MLIHVTQLREDSNRFFKRHPMKNACLKNPPHPTEFTGGSFFVYFSNRKLFDIYVIKLESSYSEHTRFVVIVGALVLRRCIESFYVCDVVKLHHKFSPPVSDRKDSRPFLDKDSW